MSTVLEPEELPAYLDLMLSPLYRTEIDETEKGSEADAVKQLATEVMDLMEKRVGTLTYHQHRHQIERSVAKKRTERRQKMQELAVTNPEARAKRKLAKNLMKRKRRDKKVEEFRRRKNPQSFKKARFEGAASFSHRHEEI